MPVAEVVVAAAAVSVGSAVTEEEPWLPVKPIESPPVAVLDEVMVVRVVAPFSVVIVDTIVDDGDEAVVVPDVADLEAKPTQD